MFANEVSKNKCFSLQKKCSISFFRDLENENGFLKQQIIDF